LEARGNDYKSCCRTTPNTHHKHHHNTTLKKGLRASFWGRPITTLAAAGAAGADALPYPEPAPAARDDVKSEEEWHRLIDEWAARLEEDLPHLREHIYEAVVMLKRATPLLMRVLDEGGFMTVCFAALHRVDPNVPVEARGLSDEAAAEFAQRSDTPLASDEDEIRKPLTQLRYGFGLALG
jgi:hypothetical protein